MHVHRPLTRSAVALLALLALSLTPTLAAAPEQSPAKACTVQGMLRIEPGFPGSSWDTATKPADLMPPEIYNRHVTSLMTTIKSTRVIKAALDAANTNLGREGPAQNLYTGPSAVAKLQKDLQVTSANNSFHIWICLTGPDPEVLKALVNAVLDQFVQQQREDMQRADAERQRELHMERDTLQNQLVDLGRGLQAARSANQLVTTTEQGVDNCEQLVRLRELVRQYADAQYRLAAASTDLEEAVKSAETAKDMTTVPCIAERLETDPVITLLRQEVAKRELVVESGPHPATDEAALAGAKKVLQAARTATAARLLALEQAKAKQRLDQAKALVSDLQTRLGESRAAAMDVARAAFEYNIRKDDYTNVNSRLSSVTASLQRMRIDSALSLPPIRIAQPAEIRTE
jgi:uncharacterized protein involved in exopolysaccharide biosynthesis